MIYLINNINYSIYKRPYLKQESNKQFIRGYYIETPIRIRGFPNDIRDLPSGIRVFLPPERPGPRAGGGLKEPTEACQKQEVTEVGKRNSNSNNNLSIFVFSKYLPDLVVCVAFGAAVAFKTHL